MCSYLNHKLFMKFLKYSLALTLLSQFSLADLFPNGDFSNGASSWAEVADPAADFGFSYPSTGGNPGGYGVITHTSTAGFGIWVGNDEQPLSLAALGLEAGKTYNFTQDMIVLSGDKMGGLKLDFTTAGANDGSSGEQFVPMIGDGSTWETYTFKISIPLGVDGFKLVPLWAKDSSNGSSIGYDNIGFDPVAVEPDPEPEPELILNGDFEQGSTGWFQEGIGATFDYPNSGGFPDGHGVINSTAPNTGFWAANNGAPISISSLGLEGGDNAIFQQDMKVLSGSDVGGLRLEFFNGAAVVGSTDDVRPSLIGDGSTWETYFFEVTVPFNAEAVKVLVLGTAGSEVGFDNVTIGDGTATPQPPAEAGSSNQLVYGTLFRWTGSNASNFFQPQTSEDNVTWTNLGPAFTGKVTGQALDPSEARFHRVLEAASVSGEVTTNGDFEDNNSDCPIGFECISPTGQFPEVITSDAFFGTNSLRIAVQNDNTPTPNQSEIQQNIAAAGGTIVPGTAYDLSFYAKQISFEVSYVQNYRLQWLNEEGAIVSEAFGFTPFTGGTDEWIEIKKSSLVAPAGASTALIQIFGATGAVNSPDAKGEVLIDLVSLEGEAGLGAGTVVEAFGFEPGVGVEFSTEEGKFYQTQISSDLVNFDDIGPLFEGYGGRAAVGTQFDEDWAYFRAIEVTPAE